MKNPKNRIILYLVILVLEICLISYNVYKLNFNVTWADFFPGPLYLNVLMALVCVFQIWRASRQMKKVA